MFQSDIIINVVRGIPETNQKQTNRKKEIKMNIKYQTIKRFAQKEGLNLIETTKHNGTPAVAIVSDTHTITIVKNPSSDVYEITVENDCGRCVMMATRFTQTSVVECLDSYDFAEYLTVNVEEAEEIEVDAEAGNEPAEAEATVEVLDTAKLKKELQRGIKEIRVQYGLTVDMLKVSYTYRQQKQGFFTIGTVVRVLEQYGDVIHAFCEKYGIYVGTENDTFTYSRRLRFAVREAVAEVKEEQEMNPEGTETTEVEVSGEAVALKTYKMNKELSEQLYNKHRNTIQVKMCYNNTFEVVSENMDVWNKVHSGSWAVCYGFMQLKSVPNMYVRHAFLLNEKDEVIDVTQFRLSEVTDNAEYHIVKEFRTMEEYLDAIIDNDGRPTLENVLANEFREYEKVMIRLGNICIG